VVMVSFIIYISISTTKASTVYLLVVVRVLLNAVFPL